MNRVPPDRERRARTLSLILPSPGEPQTPGATSISLKLRASEKHRLRELVAALNRRADGRRVFNMSSVIRYACDVLYCDVFDVSPEVVNERARQQNQPKEGTNG